MPFKFSPLCASIIPIDAEDVNQILVVMKYAKFTSTGKADGFAAQTPRLADYRNLVSLPGPAHRMGLSLSEIRSG
jgi:hypothetical protein